MRTVPAFRFLITVLGFAFAGAGVRAWDADDSGAIWPNGSIPIVAKFGGQPLFADGSSWAEHITAAATAWNRNLGRVQFTTTSSAASTGAALNDVNEVFITATPYDYTWGSGTLAMTVYWISGTTIREADVMFNANRSWYSYRGSLQYTGTIPRPEVRRVALHELGHVLGLDHPDESGQYRDAIMNSAMSSRDTISEDDGQGAAALYGPGLDNQPVAPSITSQPTSTSTYVSESAGFNVSASGTPPLRYQWRRDGAAIAGATNSSFYITSAQLTDTADYSVEVSNAGGSAISNNARLTVNLPDPPVFTWHPNPNLYTHVGSAISISFGYNGRNVTRQWYKDGVAIPGATNVTYAVSAAAKSDAGSYTAVLTNAAGSVTSTPCVVVVNDAVAPTVTGQPAGTTVTVGQLASFSITASGSAPLSYQWLKDGVPITGATSNSYSLYTTTTSGGGYACRVTNPGGTVTSAVATLLLAAESLQTWATVSEQSTYPGGSATLGTTSFGSGMRYQWYRDGIALSGATFDRLTINNVGANDLASYTLVVTNSTGSFSVRPGRVTITNNNPRVGDWLDLQTLNGVTYIAFASPGRIERYDLAAGQWLPSVNLPGTVTAFRAHPDGVYVAFGSELRKYALDLSTNSNVALLPAPAARLVVWKDHLFAMSGSSWARCDVVNRNTNAYVRLGGAMFFFMSPTMALSSTTGRLYGGSWGISPGDLISVRLTDDGDTTDSRDTPYHGNFAPPSRVFLSHDETRVAGDNGVVFRTSDLRAIGSFAGALQDVAFQPDESAIVLRGNRLHRFDANLRETATITFGAIGDRLGLTSTHAVVFSQPASVSAPIAVTRVALSTLTPRSAAPAIEASGLPFTPDEITVDRDGVVLLLSRIHRNVLRWSTSERRYLAPLPTWNMPVQISYQESGHRVLVLYPDGMITQIPAGGGAETQLASTLSRPFGIMAAGSVILAGDYSGGSWSSHLTFGSEGTLTALKDFSYYSRVFEWAPAQQRAYLFGDSSFPTNLHYETIGSGGTLSATVSSPSSGSSSYVPPIRVSPDGQLIVLGSGDFFRHSDLQRVAQLRNPHHDAAWPGGTLSTFRAGLTTATIQQWTSGGDATGNTRALDGFPLRMLTLPNGELLAVTLVSGIPRFHLLDTQLNLLHQSSSTPPPTITTQPQSRSVLANGSTTLSVVATGTGTLSYQWLFNGAAISGATGSTHTISAFDSSKAGAYSVRVTNGTSSTTSEVATVTLTDRAARFYGLSTRARVGSGSNVLIPGLSVTGTAPKKVLFRALGPQLNNYGVVGALADPTLELKTLSGTTLATSDDWDHANPEYRQAFAQLGLGDLPNGSKDCVLIATLPPGLYTPVIAGKGGTTGVALVEFYDLDSSAGNLSAISARAQVGIGSDVLIPGIIVEGNTTKKLLVRVAGPALQAYGVSGALLDPQFELKNAAGTTIFANDNWNSADPALVSAISNAGASAFAAGSKDSALLAELSPGLYTIVIRGVSNTTGVALVELFDVP